LVSQKDELVEFKTFDDTKKIKVSDSLKHSISKKDTPLKRRIQIKGKS
jgi:hypothetical protein